MCDKICFEKIKFQASNIEIENLLKEHKNFAFGKKIDITQNVDFEKNFCKNCKFC